MVTNDYEINQHIGMKIQERRKQLNLSQSDLAALMGYTSKTTISKIESGVNALNVSVLLQLAKVLNVPYQYFIDFDFEFEPSTTEQELTEKQKAAIGIIKSTDDESVQKIIDIAKIVKK